MNERRTIEQCAKTVEGLADVVGRIMASGWRGNPNMSGDDRDFMPPNQRRKHDVLARSVVEHIAAKLRAAIEVYKTQADETGWLIELEGNVPSYWALPTDDEGFWTNRAIDALRFARKQDAVAYINETGWTEAYASEHAWVVPRAALSPSCGNEVRKDGP